MFIFLKKPTKQHHVKISCVPMYILYISSAYIGGGSDMITITLTPNQKCEQM